MDVAAIEPGRDFRKAIDQSVASCSVLLAIIGQEWLASRDAAGHRRLDDLQDFVRLELASALRRDIPVVPVLVRGAKMPTAEQLPEDLKDLAFRNAVELTHARWKSDVQVLVQALRPYLDEPGSECGDGATAAKTAATMRIAETATATALAPDIVTRITRELATYIGPIAEVMVKRAAKRASSVTELCDAVAQEIETDGERARFLQACRSRF
jgi:hypothetical protein